MFREPLRRDPLVVSWVLAMLVAAFVVLSKNTTWSGHFEAYRVAGFLKDLAEVFLWAFFGLLALAWLRTRGWRSSRKDRRRYGRASSASRGVPHEPFAPFPWTDRWLRDWREADASQRRRETPTAASDAETPAACRHGLPVDPSVEVEQAPVLRRAVGQPFRCASWRQCERHVVLRALR